MEDVESALRFQPHEQIHFEKLQNVYSIVKTIEYLEWAYMSGKVKGPDYDAEFRGLIHQYKMCVESIPNFDGIDRFIQVCIHFKAFLTKFNHIGVQSWSLSKCFEKNQG